MDLSNMDPHNIDPTPEEQNAFINRLLDDEDFRRAVTTESLYWFMRVYLPRHASIVTADFQKEMMDLLQQPIPGITELVAFRDGGKSTLLRAFIIHQIVTGQKHFILIGSNTERQAQDQFKAIRREFEDKNNYLLQHDLGPFEDGDEWGKSIVIRDYDCKVATVSVEQTVRGITYRYRRPDLLVFDDIESSTSIKSREATDKIQEWVEREVIPAAAQTARFVMIGNLLTEDSVLTRIRRDIENGKRDGVFRKYPLIDDDGIVAWPEKFPTPEAIEQEKRKHTELAWKQEYLLLPVTDSEPVVRKEWLKFYRDLPKFDGHPAHRLRLISVDPAISEKSTADCTAIVTADVYGYGNDRKIYIRRNPVNKRGLSVGETAKLVKQLYDEAASVGNRCEVVVETVGLQSMYLETFESVNLPRVHAFRPDTDKRQRLALAGFWAQAGQVYIPEDEEHGMLLHQILNFGAGHDDLADAFSMLILKLTELDSGGTITVPRPYEETLEAPNLKNPDVRKKLEDELDRQTMRESEYERSNFNRSMGDALQRNRHGRGGSAGGITW
jgi:phage terminase large subunit-like protein